MQTAPGQTPSQEGRGGCAGPAGPLWVTPCSPSSGLGEGPDASPGAGVPQPCSPASTEHAGQRLRPSRSSLCSLQPLQKQAAWGVCPPSAQVGPRDGGKHSGTTHSAQWGGPGDYEEGTSSVNVTRMQTPVSQERRGAPSLRARSSSGVPGRGQHRSHVPRSLLLSLGSSVQLEDK